MDKQHLLENINHETAARPFSIHHTHVGGDNTNALYLHCHPEAEFFILDKGDISFCIENDSFDLHTGDTVFIPPNLIHNAVKIPGNDCTYDALVFSLPWACGIYANTIINSRENAVMIFRSQDAQSNEILSRLSAFKNYAVLPVRRYELKLQGEIMISLQEIYDRISEKSLFEPKDATLRSGIQASVDYMLNNFDKDLTLAEIARASGYSEGRFCHIFKEITGYTPFTYLNRIRIIKASEKIIITNEKITNIASENGFENMSYFNRVFRKHMGMSPKEYRARFR